MRTDVELTGQYLLTAVDDSNQEWSRPEWAMFYKTLMASTFLLIGSVWVLTMPNLPADAKLLGTILGPAAGYKLLETGASANNKRNPGGTNK